jgi:small subunit ribosomal protein S11
MLKLNMSISISKNNIRVLVFDNFDNILVNLTAGCLGFAGPQKKTKVACLELINRACEALSKLRPVKLSLYFNGVFKWRRNIFSKILKFNIRVISICEVSRLPHNGCKLKKDKRKKYKRN